MTDITLGSIVRLRTEQSPEMVVTEWFSVNQSCGKRVTVEWIDASGAQHTMSRIPITAVALVRT